ncbi:MAG: hypothetical protein Q8K60_00705, partial [Parachlamydiaceae bacterium]|nr:hypothetical protein [Parachlamydiaceae bacterium]
NKDKNQFHFNQIFQLYFAEAAGLYPLPIVSETGVLDLIDLNKGVANAVLFLGLPLQKTNYDGNVEANSNRFYEHDSNHFDFAQSSFDRCVNTFKDIIDDKIDYMIDIKNRYQIAQKIYNLIEEQRKINQENSYLDNFVYYFLFHEHGFAHGKKTFLTPDFDQQDFCDSIDEVIERVITDIHRITKETQVNDKGEKTEDLYDNETDIQTHIHPENALTIYDFIKAENTKGPKIPCDRYIKYTKNVENDALFDFPFYDLFYYVNYNFLIDLQDMLKPANIDLNLWENNELNEDKIIATIREVFQGFKERYRNLI